MSHILEAMLDRLLASLVNGPSLNARPHSSRQRLDLLALSRLQDADVPPQSILLRLLSPDGKVRIVASVEPFIPRRSDGIDPDNLTPAQRKALSAYTDQQNALVKLRSIAEDAREYENDTGVHCLHIGFPLLSLPPGSIRARGFSRRILAPLAFIPVDLAISHGVTPAVTLTCRAQGAERLAPNAACLAWLGRIAEDPLPELDEDAVGEKPWEELVRLITGISKMLRLPVPPALTDPAILAESFNLQPAPRADEEQSGACIVPSAVLGLYPMSNQGLIRDTQALLEELSVENAPAPEGPLQSFLRADLTLAQPAPAADVPETTIAQPPYDPALERFVSLADPSQARAATLARSARGLVIHGPPGTGKSQTIANIIGDHLARGQRVLFVCDKRTALDVVMNRLSGMGLGDLCAVVHDPQTDQRDLYRALREQLDHLTAHHTDPAAQSQLEKVDGELSSLHAQLHRLYVALMRSPDSATASFHDLVGQWFAAAPGSLSIPRRLLSDVTLTDVERTSHTLLALLRRARECDYAANPWRTAAGIPLPEFLATPMAEIRAAMDTLLDKAALVDAHPLAPDLAYPPTPADEASRLVQAQEASSLLSEIAQRRITLAALAERVFAALSPDVLTRWLEMPPALLAQRREEVELIQHQASLLATAPLDPEFAAALGSTLPPLQTVQSQIADLETYLATTRSWLGFLAFATRGIARELLRGFGLTLSPTNAQRVRDFLKAVRLRIALVEGFRITEPLSSSRPADGALLHQAAVLHDLLALCESLPADLAVAQALRLAAHAPSRRPGFLQALRTSAHRAAAIAELLTTASATHLFSPAFFQLLEADLRAGKPACEPLAALQAQLHTLEPVLRTVHDEQGLPPSLHEVSHWLLNQSLPPEAAVQTLHREAIGIQISARLRATPDLQAFDRSQLQATLERYAQLQQDKSAFVRDTIRHTWSQLQKSKLLASTGSRLNGVATEFKRRLALRGDHSTRLRQLVTTGQDGSALDTLLTLRPVWMASPETVAQVFPRQAVFDVVVFDEASQCKLEEALPVLLRAKRVVIAGDPKQLPPSRFFEAAVTVTQEEEAEDEQSFFERQQGEIEDLLTASLNLEIEEAYLDVHYRSRNADLIEFSNQHFYGSRLQAIPAHPANRVRYAPLTLYHANGTYENRENAIEAERVCTIVRDLLRRAEPPSIGIACFNLQQRDMILEKLEELAAADDAFARSLSAARNLRRNGAFEGLFVKNLENVQGDERDHIIISTTYGPDPQGRFYKRFGPLGQSGGGRRLNVLVTRARQEVHLVTSIPQNAYRNLEPVPPDKVPGGPYLLFSYLNYAETLAEAYEHAHQQDAANGSAATTPPQEIRSSNTRFPSRFAESLATHLLQNHATGSHVYYGNDGFCVDVALQHPAEQDNVTLGILCDLTRFDQSADPVQWEIFRTQVLLSQGWKLHRLWTPNFFRDPTGQSTALLQQHP